MKTKTRFFLVTEDGKFASYDMKTGVRLTPVISMSYAWHTQAEAEQQRPLYEGALNVTLTVKEMEI